MTQRTANIIGICKGISHKYSSNSVRRNIASYMSNECMVDIDYYTDEQVDSIIVEAFMDFIDGVDMPSKYLKDIFYNKFYNKISSPVSIANSIISVFTTTRIKNDKTYVNGFSKKLIDQMNKDIEIDIAD